MKTINHILILEDDDQLSRLYEKVLQHHQHRTLRLSHVQEAIHSLLKFDPDVVCLDWTLGDSTSAPLLDALSLFPPESRPEVLLVSGRVDGRTVQAQYPELVRVVQPKPISVKTLVETVQHLLHLGQQRQPLQEASYQLLEPGKFLMTWRGVVTPQLIRAHMSPRLHEAETVIWDIRHICPYRLQVDTMLESYHSPLPNLKRVYVVYEADNLMLAHYLVRFLPPATEFIFCRDMEEALG